MEQPKYYRDAEGNTFELVPQRVDRGVLEADHAQATSEAKTIDSQVDDLQRQIDELQTQLGALNDKLGPLLDAQEAAQEKVAFHDSRLANFDAATAADNLADDGAEGAAAEDLDGNDADDDDLDGEDEPDEDTDEPDEEENELEDEELIVPIRHRAKV